MASILRGAPWRGFIAGPRARAHSTQLPAAGIASATLRSGGARKPRLVLLGTGWGAFAAATAPYKSRLFDVTFVSPRNHLVFTPLLPGASVGSIEFRSIAECVKYSFPDAAYVMGSCTGVDLAARTLALTLHGGEGRDDAPRTATLPFDLLVIGGP